VTLGDGWYRGRLQMGRNVYGDKLALLAQIEVVYQDGKREVITSDKDWKVSTGPILFSSIYDGELYDARLEMNDWSRATFDDSAWTSVKVINHRKDFLVAPAGPPVKRIEELKPVKIFTTPAGLTVVDMGQNMAGWIRLEVQGPAGTRIKLRHGEVLDMAGNFYTENLTTAKQTVEYILKGQGQEIYEPQFTFQGFRYVAVEGWPGELSLDDLTGVVIHSDFKVTGTFECSNRMINQLQHNITWSQKGNFLDIPTDCPQRCERLGWTGDAQVFARTACFNGDLAAFYTKWLVDLYYDQQPNGSVPFTVPSIREYASAGWGDAATVVPWTVYLCYGDKRILEKQYSSMKGWVDYIAAGAGESYFWTRDFTFGDWLSFSSDRPDYPGATTSKDLVRQAYFARSTDLVQRAAKILGKTDDAEKYEALLAKVKKVFQDEFLTPNSRVSSDTQTAYSLALMFDLLPVDKRAKAAQRLAGKVDEFGHITTGFIGTPLICHALSENGYPDRAYRLLNRTDYPSWLYAVTKGATTIWECWNSIKPDGSFREGGSSFNHYAYGAIGEWLYRVVAGIELDEQNPGYKHIIIQPTPGGGLTYAKASYDSIHGKIATDWRLDDNCFKLAVTIPANTTATIFIPAKNEKGITECGNPADQAEGVNFLRMENGSALYEVGSGVYHFVSKK
jgi:alpha-L-rhamnosidase